MTHSISFQLPSAQRTVLTALWNKACSAATVDEQTPPAQADWLATTLLQLLTTWLAYYPTNGYSRSYPIPATYPAGKTFTATLTLTDAAEANATQYYSQYTADMAASGLPAAVPVAQAGATPVAEDTLLSGVCQRQIMDFVAKAATDPLVNFRLVAMPVGPVPQGAAPTAAGPLPTAGPFPVTPRRGERKG